jgi:exodeoxyribonuclease VII large subunit
LFDKNKLQPMAVLPQRIAIISVESSKGYADFMQVIENNAYGYRFFHMLFPSLLQGDKAAAQIVAQLKRIKKVKHHFDAVAIIRGGGGDVGLSCYNNYALSKTIASFPLPVLTGIGHSTNETVAEMVAHTNAITPTKLGEILIQHFHNFAVPVENAAEQIADAAHSVLQDARQALQYAGSMFRGAVNAQLSGREYALLGAAHKLRSFSQNCIAQQVHKLALIENTVQHLDPQTLMQKGYSITLHNGKPLTDASVVEKGDLLITQLANGAVQSTVTDKSEDYE